MEEKNHPDTYVFSKKVVLASINALLRNQIHEHFPGYLAILRARASGVAVVRLSHILDFYERYLRIEDAPEKSPYLQPFQSRGKATSVKLFNKNVSGSYAPSSVRKEGSLANVIRVVGSRQKATYELAENHHQAAFTHLLKETKVPITALAAVLYRDYGILLDTPSVSAVTDLFRREFGLSNNSPAEKAVYDTLFTDDSSKFSDADLTMI